MYEAINTFVVNQGIRFHLLTSINAAVTSRQKRKGKFLRLLKLLMPLAYQTFNLCLFSLIALFFERNQSTAVSWVYECTCVCTAVWMTEPDIECLPLSWSTIFFEAGSLTDPGPHLSHQIGWSESSRDPPFSAGITGLHNYALPFTCMLGICSSKYFIEPFFYFLFNVQAVYDGLFLTYPCPLLSLFLVYSTKGYVN